MKLYETRNTDTIKNTHVRKLTSIALMAIMVGGGLTFAIPGMEPAYAAQIDSEPNLKVSAEGQNADNEIASTNIVEVIVRDGDINESDDELTVTVDDNELTMTFYSGAWYAYFANDDIVGTGLITIDADDANDQVAVNALVTGSPFTHLTSPTDASAEIPAGATLDVQLFDLDGEFDVVYEKPGNAQTVTLELDDPDSGISLDRSNYPQNTDVVVTIDHQTLNVDPTSEDSWFLVVGDDPRYLTADDADSVKTITDAATKRDNAIDRAWNEYRDAIANADSDLEDFTDRADDARDQRVADALQVRNDARAEAQAVLDDPLSPTEDDNDNNAVNTKAEANEVIGTGDAVEFDGEPDDPEDGTTDGTLDEYTTYVGTAQIAYEGVAGRGDQTSTDVDDPNYEGTAKDAYDNAIAAETETRDNTIGTHSGAVTRGANDVPVRAGDVTANPSNFEAYQTEVGTAQTDLELVVGHGNQLSTVTIITNDVEYDVDFYGTALINYDSDTSETVDGNTVDVVLPMRVVSMDESGMEPFGILSNGLLECATSDCTTVNGAMWVKFTEDGTNNNLFTNSPDDDANLKTTIGAQRGLSFELEYDNGVEGGIGFSTTTISIDTDGDWGSGEEISVTLTDPDANTNSLTEDDLSVRTSDQTIPTIKIGNPLTLAEADSVTLNGDDVEYRITPVSEMLVVDLPTLEGGTDYELSIAIGNWNDIAADYFVQDTDKFMGASGVHYDVGSLADNARPRIHIDNIAEHVPEDFDRKFMPHLVYNDDHTNPTRQQAIDGFLQGKPGADQLLGMTPAGFTMPIFPGTYHQGEPIYHKDGTLVDIPEESYVEITFTTERAGLPAGEYPLIFDLFTIGLTDREDLTSTTNNAIYRLELAEDGDNSSDFIGTLEYIALNQINVVDTDTYVSAFQDAISDEITFISDDSSISVEYYDLDSTGGFTTFTAEADTPTHSGSVALDSDGYKVADTVTVTVEDADLNADSTRTDVYTPSGDSIGSTSYYDDGDDSNDETPRLIWDESLLTVFIDDEEWAAGCGLGGLDASTFSLRETGRDSGMFTGTFSIPANHCNDGDAVTVTGTDISVEYVDFRDDSGSVITVSASAGIRSSTGSVSLDRTVYPVPIGDNPETDTNFATHGDASLGQIDLTVYVSVTDSDADTSANGVDSIDADTVTMEIIRGSQEMQVDITDSTISETAPDSGVFELEMSIAYDSGPDEGCPAGLTGCILQGDIIHVVYTDQSDASGSENTVTDSATFDLRNGVLQSDQTAYIIGSDAIITLIEPDLNLDSDSTETYTLDLIEWDSDAGTATLDDGVFGATPSNLLETGPDTGIFQVVVSIPDEIDGDKLERGEEISLEYVDWGPSGSDYVGDKDESITATIYTSNFGATIELDQRVYTWTDKVYITVVAPDHNIDSDQVDEIGNDDDYPVRVSTRGNEIEQYKLVETGADTGIFTGEVILTGFANHDADGDGNDGDATGRTSPEGSGPTNGEIETESESGISVSFKYSDGETVSSSALIRWNVGEVQWLEASYPASGSGIVRIIDPDMNLNPEAVDNFDVTVFSDSDGGGISLTVTETNAATGIFEGTVFFGVGVDTSGHRLRVVEGDTVTAQYYDNTLPAPFKETERVRVGATTLIGTVVPPLERVPISDLRAVDSFGSTLDTISVDSQIQLAADLTNGQDKSQDFAYLIQIQDGNGVTVSLNWITGSLSAGQSLSPATSWTPDEAGTYEVTAFAWESIENPTALSPTATITITVN